MCDSKNVYCADTVITGSGSAGMMAGLAIIKAGFSCIILEKGKNPASSNASIAGGPALAATAYQAAENAVRKDIK